MVGPESDASHEVILEALQQPVPDMTDLRRVKAEQGYSAIPIDQKHQRFDEPIVYTNDYGIAGQNHYSRPNSGTIEPVPGIETTPQLRLRFAEILQDINGRLDNSAITEFFGGEVELYIEDALRPIALQRHLHDTVFPERIKRQQPGLNEEEVDMRVSELIAIGSDDPVKPSPHATGGACDVILRFKQDKPGYVAGSQVPMGHEDGDTSKAVYPDHFEHIGVTTDVVALAQRNRRAFYAIMTGKAFGFDTGLSVNPTEFWHYDYGDQLWALARNEPAAFYSIPKATAR